MWISFAPIYKVPENFLVSCKTTFKEKRAFFFKIIEQVNADISVEGLLTYLGEK